jgi:hypothetical protein
MTKYVISLNRKGRRKELQPELERALKETPTVQILEGYGCQTFTVLMPEDTRAALKSRLTFATISDYEELELL